MEYKAGDELDRLIAEKLGYTDFEKGRDFWWAWRPVRNDETEHDLKYHLEDGRIQDPIPNYSTNLDAAFLLPLDGEHFFALHGPCDGVEDFYAFVMERWTDPRYDNEIEAPYRAWAESGALALCLVWLMWYGVKHSVPGLQPEIYEYLKTIEKPVEYIDDGAWPDDDYSR